MGTDGPGPQGGGVRANALRCPVAGAQARLRLRLSHIGSSSACRGFAVACFGFALACFGLALACFGFALACSGGPATTDVPLLIDVQDSLGSIDTGGGDSSSAADGRLVLDASEDCVGRASCGAGDAHDSDLAEELYQGLLDFTFEGGTELPDYEFPPPPDIVSGCIGNGDGVIELSEFPAKQALGLVATYTVNKPGTQVPIPGLGGKQQDDKVSWAWDFSAKIQGKDEVHYESILPLSSFWFQKHYPDGEFVQPFSADYMGVYRLDATGLYLLGIASADKDVTALAYGESVLLLPLPLKAGKAWDALDVPADGLYEGQAYPADYGAAGKLSVTHSYSFVADKKGSVKVPAGSYPVQRVYLDLEMAVHNSLMPTPVAQKRVRIALFVAECAGTVALVRSLEGETQKEFQWASEYKRLGF